MLHNGSVEETVTLPANFDLGVPAVGCVRC
jgi:hypothetical protein